MSSPAIDYTALAEQARKTAPPVDYAALADQARSSTPAAPPKGFTDHLGDFAGHTWDALTGSVTGTVGAVMHPIDTASTILRDAADEIAKGKQAYEKGDYDRAAEHFKYALPVAGPLLRQMRQETDAGDYGAALGDITGTVLGGKLLARVPEIPGAVKSAAPVVTAAAKAGGADLAIGAGKAAAGAALAKAGPLGEIGDVIAGVPIVKSGVEQIGRGAKAAFQAGRDAYKSAQAPEPTPAPVRTPIWTGPPGRPATPLDMTPIPGKLPSGRVPGGPAIDPATGQIVENIGNGEFKAAAPNPAKAAFDAARAGKPNTPPPPEAAPPDSPAPAAHPGDGRGPAPFRIDPNGDPTIRPGQPGSRYVRNTPPPPEAAPPASPAATPPPPSSPGTPGAATPPSPAGAIDAPAKLPPKLITENQLSQYANENGLSVEDADAALSNQNVRVIDRVSLNRTLHAQVGDHETLSDIAKSTYNVDSLKKLSDEQMLELVDRFAKEQAAPAEAESPLAAQMRESLAQVRAKRAAAAAKKVTAPSEHPGKAAFEAARVK